MRLLVFGATGGTGQHIVRQALREGHKVTAFSRNPDSLSIRHENLQKIKGNILSPLAVENAVKGHNAVICAIGTKNRSYTTVLSEGTKNIIDAMEKRRIKRFVCLTSVGVLGHDAGFFLKYFIIPLFYKNLFKDRRQQLEHIMRSDLDWVVVRAVKLNDGPRTKYHATMVRPITRQISRKNVANFMLKQLENNSFLREIPIVSGLYKDALKHPLRY